VRRELTVIAVDKLPFVTRRTAYHPGETVEVEVWWRQSGQAHDPLALELRAAGPAGVNFSAPAGRPGAGESGVSLFRLAFPADAPPGTYHLSLVAGGQSAELASVPLSRQPSPESSAKPPS
jgi:uncharacterized protein YfaS (alpha-2-macroglobulin family)